MNRLDALWKQGKDFLGVKTPIMAGAMTWISDSAFTAAVSNKGAFGCLAGGNTEPQQSALRHFCRKLPPRKRNSGGQG